MSSCCDSNQKPKATFDKIDKNQPDDKEPTGFVNKFFYKIGKADAHKDQGEVKEDGGCC
jgi:soluble cytochrome b562